MFDLRRTGARARWGAPGSQSGGWCAGRSGEGPQPLPGPGAGPLPLPATQHDGTPWVAGRGRGLVPQERRWRKCTGAYG